MTLMFQNSFDDYFIEYLKAAIISSLIVIAVDMIIIHTNVRNELRREIIKMKASHNKYILKHKVEISKLKQNINFREKRFVSVTNELNKLFITSNVLVSKFPLEIKYKHIVRDINIAFVKTRRLY